MVTESETCVQAEVKEKPWQSNIKSLPDGICHIYETGEFSDTTINVKGKKFKAHSLLLKAGSSEFEKMFLEENHPKEISLVCPVKGFEILLRFVYTNELGTTDRVDILDTFRTAQKFKQNDLMQKCEELIGNWDINCENVCSILNLASDIDFLKERCIQFLKLNQVKVIESEDFLKATPSSVMDMFSNKCFEEVPVTTLLYKTINWGTSQIGSPENYKSELPIYEVIKKFLLDIGILGKLNIQKLSVEEILDFGIQFPDFLTPKESQQFSQNAFKRGQNLPLPDWCESS